VKRSVAALPTGSSRQRLNGFIGRTQPGVGLDGSAPNICFSAIGGNFPCQGCGTEAASASILRNILTWRI
jgi:hypothetical protein